MRRLPCPPLLRIATVAVALASTLTPLGYGWGSDGHRMINRLAVESLPPDAPMFLRAPAAFAEIDYLGPEPDRWRSPAEPELSYAQAPEHFINFENADVVGTLPKRRSDLVVALTKYREAHPETAAEETPERVGLQPWEANEVWERLKAAFRDYRADLGAPEGSPARSDLPGVEAAAIFYCGWLGHYVGDGSQPLHVSVQYNGWTGPNPNGYTTAHTIHAQFETQFVAANIKAGDVRPFVAPAQPMPNDWDEWTEYLAYLRKSGTYTERVYQLEKVGGFTGAGTPESRRFTEERLAAGAAMLRDMIEAAWVESALPVPDPHAATPVKAEGSKN